ncbi:MAG: spore germination protein [Lachnospiraceae bacterium]
MNQKISSNYEENLRYMKQELRLEKNFDIVYRVISIGERKAVFFCIDGFTKDEILEKLLEFMFKQLPEKFPKDAHEFSKTMLPYGEINLMDTWEDVIVTLLSGMTLLFIDGYDKCLIIDCRTYPARSVGEPEKDKVLRGSRDGFVETLTFNTALIRRRIRDPQLTMEMRQAGRRSMTDIAICYINDRVNQKFLQDILSRIERLDVDALTMNQQSLAECLFQYKWYNPFPKFKFTERPDTAAACILEGNIIILVDNSPSAIVLPTSIFDIVEEADDYYFPPVTGTYLRLSRFIISIFTLELTPVFLLLTMYPEWVPNWLKFIEIKDTVNVPIIFQLLILELAIDGLRLAAVNTPNMLTTPLSVMAALVLGEFSVNSGWFNSEAMLYMAFVALANYTQASFELGYALKFMRIIILILTAILGVWGFIAGQILTVLAIVKNKTVSGDSYIYPLVPLSLDTLKRRFFRVRLPHREKD